MKTAKYHDIIKVTAVTIHNMRKMIAIVETYAHGFKNFRGQQCDVFRNPSRREWREVVGKNSHVRAFLDGNDILIWNSFGALHQNVRDTMKLSNDVISLIIYGKPGTDAVIIVTDNTRNTVWWHNGDVADEIIAHPYIRRNFIDVELSFYDEDIVGDWRELTE